MKNLPGPWFLFLSSRLMPYNLKNAGECRRRISAIEGVRELHFHQALILNEFTFTAEMFNTCRILLYTGYILTGSPT